MPTDPSATMDLLTATDCELMAEWMRRERLPNSHRESSIANLRDEIVRQCRASRPVAALSDAEVAGMIREHISGHPCKTDAEMLEWSGAVKLIREVFARGASSVDTTAARREGWNEALARCVELGYDGWLYRALAEERDRRWPLPVPPIPASVRLSDGTYFWWFKGSSPRITWNRTPEDQRPVNGEMCSYGWVALMHPTDTGEDFEKVKALAASVEAK